MSRMWDQGDGKNGVYRWVDIRLYRTWKARLTNVGIICRKCKVSWVYDSAKNLL